MFTLLEIGAQGTLFILRQTYYLGRYLIYGRTKTREEILEEQLHQQNALLLQIRSELNNLKSDDCKLKDRLTTEEIVASPQDRNSTESAVIDNQSLDQQAQSHRGSSVKNEIAM